MKNRYLCKILSREEIAKNTISLLLDASEVKEPLLPGQFFHLECGGRDSYLRRPISICDFYGGVLRLVFEVRGAGTKELSRLEIGGTADILGPLGNGFSLPKNARRAAIVGGGIGAFPLLFLARRLDFECDIFLGFRTQAHISLEKEFSALENANITICTDDGSRGFCGYAPAAFENTLKSEKYDIVYTCGPRPMMESVAKIAASKSIPCQVSIEERMGCGIGACLVCACKLHGADKNIGHVCIDGPVFYADKIFPVDSL